MNDEIQHILCGKSKIKHGTFIKTVQITLEEAKKQAQWLKQISTSKKKKQQD